MDLRVDTQFGKLSSGLATALATPSLLLAAPAATAQDAEPATLSPIQVQGTRPAPFLVKESASEKFTAPVLDTAKSLQIIPQELIQSQAATTLTDVLRNSPGITFGAGEGGNPLGDRPFIRGYDAQSSTFVDGMRDIGATSREVFNLEQVEIIKGADGAYAGRGGAGGSIDLISKTAKLRDFTNVSIGAGTANYLRQTVDSNWQLGESTAFRLNAMNHSQDIDGRDAVDNKRWGIAPTISFGLGTPTRVTLGYYHLETDEIPDSGIPYTLPGGTEMRTPVDVDRHNFYGLKSDYRRTGNDMGTLQIEHDFSDTLTLHNQTRYTRGTQRYVVTQPDDSKGNVNKGMVWRRANTRDSRVSTWANQTELQGEFRTGQLKHRFLAGIEFSAEDGRKDSLAVNRGTASCASGMGAAGNYTCTSLDNPDPGDPWVNSLNGGPLGKSANTRTLTKSIYAFDTIKFNPQWQTTLGLRLDDYTTRVNPYGSDQIERHDTLLNYQLGLVYKPADNGSIYVSYGTSSTPAGAGLNEGSGNSVVPGGRTPLNAADTAPEKNRTMELGTKWDFLDGRLGLTTAIFRVETTNARITDAYGLYTMGGNRRVDGFELGLSGNITPQWQVYGGYTYLKSRIRENGANSSYEGNEFPNTPKSSFSLWSSYDFTPQLTAGAGAYYVDMQYGNEANTISIPSYWRFDAMAAYRFSKTVDLQINVNNLFNKTYYDKAYASHYASIAPGRAAMATLNLHF